MDKIDRFTGTVDRNINRNIIVTELGWVVKITKGTNQTRDQASGVGGTAQFRVHRQRKRLDDWDDLKIITILQENAKNPDFSIFSEPLPKKPFNRQSPAHVNMLKKVWAFREKVYF